MTQEKKLPGIYVASSWRNLLQSFVVTSLRGHGFNVYDFRNPPDRTGFAWETIDQNWKNWGPVEYIEALGHPLAIAGFNSDFDAMKAADICVLVMPCGRSAHIEAGWMKGNGKQLFIINIDQSEPELMYKIADHVITSWDEFNCIFYSISRQSDNL